MNIRSILAVSFGNILEWYDFALFTAYADIFAQHFFPNSDPYAAMLAVFGIFAAGFICRPLGAIIFGHFGDKSGRIKTLRASILIISIPTFLIGCLPTYANIGVYAAVLLTLIRLTQGVCMGGEFTGIIIYLCETAPKRHRGLLSSFAATGANMGILLATVVVSLLAKTLPQDMVAAWGWRLPFLLGGAFGVAVYWLRLNLTETQVFNSLLEKHDVAKVPLNEVLLGAPWLILRTIGLVCMGATFYYLCFIYLSNYLNDVISMPLAKATQLLSIFILTMLVLVPLAGVACDKLGRKTMLLTIAGLIIISIVPIFNWLASGQMPLMLLALTLLTLISSMEQGTTAVTVVENFPARLRYTGISLGYNLGYALFGGTAPLIAAWLFKTTGSPLSPAYYLMFWACVTLLVVVFTVSETKACSLEN